MAFRCPIDIDIICVILSLLCRPESFLYTSLVLNFGVFDRTDQIVKAICANRCDALVDSVVALRAIPLTFCSLCPLYLVLPRDILLNVFAFRCCSLSVSFSSLGG